MNFCEEWRAQFSDTAPLDDGCEVFGIESDDTALATPAMRALSIQPSDNSAILLPLDSHGDLAMISGRGSCRPGNLCEIPLSLGGVEYALSPSLLSTVQGSSVLGSIQNAFSNSNNQNGYVLDHELPCGDFYWGEVTEVPNPLSKLTFGGDIVKRFFWFASYSLGRTIIELGISAFAHDASKVYPTLQQLWEDSISAIEGTWEGLE